VSAVAVPCPAHRLGELPQFVSAFEQDHHSAKASGRSARLEIPSLR
jgi:hypothetical protein